MRSSHRAGSNSGVDYATVVMFLLWIALTIVLVVVLLTRGSAADAARSASRHASKVPCAGFPAQAQKPGHQHRHSAEDHGVGLAAGRGTRFRCLPNARGNDRGERILTKDAN